MILGLTGSFGSGKSTVADMFQTMGGAHVIDADQVARDVQQPGTEGLKKIAAAFGNEIIKEDGHLNRGKLADIVFKDDSQLERLNNIIHPLAYAELGRQLEQVKEAELVVLMVPLLFETGGDQLCDKVAVVIVTEEERIKRLIVRDELTKQQIQERLAAQMPQGEKVARADYVIDNSGSPEDTRSQVQTVLQQLGLAAGHTS